jgi:integrase
LLQVKDERGAWVQRATPFRIDVPGDEQRALALLVEVRAKLQATQGLTDETGLVTVRAWSKKWLIDRRASGVRDVDNDESRLDLHVLAHIGEMPLAEVRARHLVELFGAMKKAELAPKTIWNTYSTVKAMWRDARIADVLTDSPDPCILTHRQLGKVRDARPGWREAAVYTRDELEQLIGDPRVPMDRRVLYGLLGVAMLRDGEAAGLLWGRVGLDVEPLGRIVVACSYDHEWPKTQAERWMPIHPTLHAVLAEWKLGGWAQMMGRPPSAEDLVVPCSKPTNRGPRKPLGAMRDKNYIWKRITADLVRLGARHRRAHDLRRTGISLARADGADELLLKRGTHAPPRNVMGLYTSVEWETLCREVAKLRLDRSRHAAQGN